VPAEERILRFDLLRNTLRALSRKLEQTNEQLDAVVISGDVTIANAEDGFQSLIELFDEFGVRRSHILVVPGNHDVAWRTPPSTEERYRNFISYIRDADCITPLLDGIDFESSGRLVENLVIEKHLLALDSGRIAVVPFNSANYSGVLAPLPGMSRGEFDRISSQLSHSQDKDLLHALVDRLRLHDAARISPAQMEAVAHVLRQAVESNLIAPEHVPIAVLHHHLLPVSGREEVKTFDSLTNLGLFRSFLQAKGFRVVLHGHKHESRTYLDDILPPGTNAYDSNSHRVLVISGSTLGGSDFSRSELCRMIAIDTSSCAPEATVTRLPAVDAGQDLPEPREHESTAFLFDFDGVPLNGICTVTGTGVDDAYDKLMAIFRHTDVPISGLAVTISAPKQGPIRLPRHFPDIPDMPAGTPDAWLEDIVRWWQRSSTRLSGISSYTHGMREYRYGEEEINQIDRIIRVLSDKPETSRAIVNMIDPLIDDVSERTWKFPGCCMMQFSISFLHQQPLLNATVYYRRQEMRYWWPINIAEIYEIMNEVINGIRLREFRLAALSAGKITTFANVAYAGDACPRVAVPYIDRMFDEDPLLISEMAFSIFRRNATDAMKEKWNRVLDELVPEERVDETSGMPVAKDGLVVLHDLIMRFSLLVEDSKAAEIAHRLKSLVDENNLITSLVARETGTIRTRHLRWRARCHQLVQETRTLLYGRWENS
jgi:3',5'-cyclic AMP phosphodiesterase CpdA